ncbi:PH domain-containing protein [Brachybacterium paraconglomeratum]|uniref:PH domain-containing protein n=1 Tax=Brachybacterium paraconglomeratum TaxID=173362 RepID=UPI0031ECE174
MNDSETSPTGPGSPATPAGSTHPTESTHPTDATSLTDPIGPALEGSALPDADAPLEATEPDPSTPRRRTHPITPLVTGWKIVVGVIAVLAAQNIAQLLDEFTVQRALIGAGILLAAALIAIAFSTLSWWFTTYAVDEEGVSLHSGMISRSREYAPRARIESVSVERPLLARLLGLAKVRVEVAGGGESYLDIEYIKSAAAEDLRRGILGIAERSAPEQAAERTVDRAEGYESTGLAGTPHPHPQHEEDAGAPGRLEELLTDGVTDGELIAQVPTERLVRSLLRDIGFLIGVVMSIVGVAVAVALAIWQDGINIAMFIALAPAAIAVPKYIFGRIESGWGFVSRITGRGLRMRRGLANTRTDNIVSGRIQRIELRRPLLWRGPGWTAATATVAGIDDDSENGAENVLPVGTREELRATLGHLAVPLGTADDMAFIEQLLTAPAREIDGFRTRVRAYWIARRTEVTVLLPGALVKRGGVLTRHIEIVPRERIQQLSVDDGPLNRKLGVLDLQVGIAGETVTMSNLPRTEVLGLHSVLSHDAATLRRYRDRQHWPQPALSLAAPAGQLPHPVESEELR